MRLVRRLRSCNGARCFDQASATFRPADDPSLNQSRASVSGAGLQPILKHSQQIDVAHDSEQVAGIEIGDGNRAHTV